MIPFTQYLMPDGKTRVIEIDRPESIEKMAEECIDKGLVFTIEILNTGYVSMTCEDMENSEEVYAGEIAPNGPEVPLAVDKLVIAAYGRINNERITKNTP